MKYYTLTLAFSILSCFAFSQQIKLTGRVSVFNSKYNSDTIEYVQNAYATSDSAVADDTDIEGWFELIFRGIDASSAVIVNVEKSGYEVVNKRDLELVILSRDLPLAVYLASEGQLTKARSELYNYNIAALYAEKDSIIDKLRGSEMESKAAIADLQERFGQEIENRFEAEELLNKKVEALEKRLPEVVQELATRNLDFASELYIDAFEYFKKGEIEKVLQILDDTIMEQSDQEAIKAYTDGDKFEIIGKDMKEKALLKRDKNINTYQLKAESFILLFNYRSAAKQYERIITLLVSLPSEEVKLAYWYEKVALLYYEDGKFTKALEYYQNSISIREGIFDPKHPELAYSYSNIGGIYEALADYKKALEYHLKAIIILEEILDHKTPGLAICYNNIAITYQALADYSKALEYHQKAISIQEILIPKHPDLAHSYGNIGNTYWARGNYQKSIHYHKKAITIQEEILKPKHPDLAVSYSNIGGVFYANGDYQEALEYQQKSIAIQEDIPNPKHPELAVSYDNIGITYQALRDYQKALEYHQKAIIIQEEILDPKHPSLAISYGNIGVVYQLLGVYQKALEYHHKAITIQEKILNPKHPSLAISYGNIGVTYQALADNFKALQYHQKAITIQKEFLNPMHPDLAVTYCNIAYTYKEIGDLSEALENGKYALAIFRSTLPYNHPNQQAALNLLFEVYFTRGMDAFKNKEYGQALLDFDSLDSYIRYAAVLNYTGLCYYYLNEYSKSIESYQRAAEIEPEIKSSYFYNNLGMAYAKNGQFDLAGKAFHEFENLFPEEGRTYRNWAMYYGLQNEKEKAIFNLEKAVQLGYDDWDWITTDESLESIRGEPQYKEIVKELELKKN